MNPVGNGAGTQRTAEDSTTANDWTPSSWRARPAQQLPDGQTQKVRRSEVFAELAVLPPLVFAGEARRLTKALASVADGRSFLLQAGDCAESFDELRADVIRDKLKVILQMAVVLTYGAGVPVVKVGRIAGQFAKPRSSPTERIGDVEMPAFRGHIINDDAPSPIEARLDPRRMVRAYHHSSSTLNLLRAFTKGGFADLSQVHAWNQEFLATSAEGRRYEAIAEEIDRALRFMAACGVDLSSEAPIQQVDFYTSHEALLLDYEEALTRRDSLTGKFYDCSAHMVWIGERTHQIDGAHVEFAAGIHNPIGIKLGPSATGDEVVELLERLNPEREPGRITLIVRTGVDKVTTVLPGRSSTPCRPPVTRSCGRAIRCTATPSPQKTAARPDTSMTCWRRFAAFSPSTRQREPGRAAYTSSSPVMTSPSASAVWKRFSRNNSRCVTRQRVILA